MEITSKHPIDLYLEISAKYPEWLDWEPETVTITLELTNKDSEIDKVLAVQTVAKNPNAVTRNSFIFEKVANSFCNGFPIMDTHTKPYIEELVYTTKQIKKIVAASQDEKFEDIEFTGDVPNYVAAVAVSRGWIVLPKSLEWAQESLNYLTGISEGSAKYKEYYSVVTSLTRAVKDLPDDFETLISSEQLEGLETSILAKYVGAYLYDPTTI